MKKNIIIINVLFCCLMSYGQVEKGTIFIKNGTVLTITNGIIENADIFIQSGKITRIGQDLPVPADITVIDATGKYVMPGIIDAHSHIGIDVVNEATDPNTSNVFIGDGVDPYDIDIYHALAGGVTVSHALHGSANAIGGQSETLKHRWGTHDPEVMKMEGAPRTIKFALGENPMRVHGEGNHIVPATRMGVEQIFREAFSKAIKYRQKWKNYRSNPQASKEPPKYDLKMETMNDILDGEIIVHCHSYRADEILMLVDVLSDFGVDKICFQHVNEGFKVAPELAEYGAMASVFADWWAYKFEVYYSTAYNAAILAQNGVITSINSDSRELIRHLYHEAGKSQRYGNLSDNEALKLITINSAIQLGIEDRVGSIEIGKDGDIVIFDHHPLSIYAIPQKTIVDGIVRFDINDPDDMRMEIDPKEELSTYYERMHDHEHDDACMQDAMQFFNTNEK